MEGLRTNMPSAFIADLFFTGIAIVMFASMGFTLRRYLGAVKRNRPLKETLPMSFVRRTRPWKIKQYKVVAEAVLSDVHNVILEKTPNMHEVRAFLPLLVDVRRKGESLLASRSALNRTLIPWWENHLPPLVRELVALEETLKSMPKSHLTIEDVLAGKFE